MPTTSAPAFCLPLLAGAAAAAQPCQPRWDPVGAAADLDGGVHAMAAFTDELGPALYLGGAFEHAGPLTAKRVVRWDGANWSALGSGVEANTHGIFGCCARVYALQPANVAGRTTLFVGGEFILAGGLTVESIAAYRAGAWSDLAGGLLNLSCRFDCGPRVHALLAVDRPGPVPDLYLAGTFTDSFNGRPISRVARWDGADFHALGAGIEEVPGESFPFWAESLALFDDGRGTALYVAGRFGMAGGARARDVARWDGAAWSDVGGGLASSIPGRVTAAKTLAVFDDGRGPALYVAGEFDRAGRAVVSNIARWDGAAWSDVGGGTDQQVLALFVHDDGAGPALFAGGQFTTAGGAPASRVAKWDGRAWLPLGDGADGDVHCFQAFNDGSGPALFVGGWFQNAGNQPSPYWARWVGCPVECYPDCDTSTGRFVLDIFDFLCFQNRYDTGNPYACDCDTSTGGGVCDIFDFLCFQNAFATGCP